MHYLFDFLTINMKIKLFNKIDEIQENNSIQENIGTLKENIQQLQVNNQLQNQEILILEKKEINENNIINENDMRNELSKLINSKLDKPNNNNTTLISDLPNV